VTYKSAINKLRREGKCDLGKIFFDHFLIAKGWTPRPTARQGAEYCESIKLEHIEKFRVSLEGTEGYDLAEYAMFDPCTICLIPLCDPSV